MADDPHLRKMFVAKGNDQATDAAVTDKQIRTAPNDCEWQLEFTARPQQPGQIGFIHRLRKKIGGTSHAQRRAFGQRFFFAHERCG